MARCNGAACSRWRPDLLALTGRVGVLLDEGWFCSAACLERSARRRLIEARRGQTSSVTDIPPLKVGVMLLYNRAVSRGDLGRALDAQARTGLRLGEQLIGMGLATSEEVLKALASQAGVGYLIHLDPARVAATAGHLSPDAVYALGLVPFEVDEHERRVKLACVAPIPRLAMAAVRELTGWTASTFLVADESWPDLLAAVYRAAGSDGAPSVHVHDVAAAAARVAHAAEGRGGARMSHAACDPYLWVRVEGRHTVEDVLLDLDQRAS